MKLVKAKYGYKTFLANEENLKNGYFIPYNFFFFNDDVKEVIEKEKENIEYMKEEFHDYLTEKGLEYFSPGMLEFCGDFIAYTEEKVKELISKYKYYTYSFDMIIKDSNCVLQDAEKDNYFEIFDKDNKTLNQFAIEYINE